MNYSDNEQVYYATPTYDDEDVVFYASDFLQQQEETFYDQYSNNKPSYKNQCDSAKLTMSEYLRIKAQAGLTEIQDIIGYSDLLADDCARANFLAAALDDISTKQQQQDAKEESIRNKNVSPGIRIQDAVEELDRLTGMGPLLILIMRELNSAATALAPEVVRARTYTYLSSLCKPDDSGVENYHIPEDPQCTQAGSPLDLTIRGRSVSTWSDADYVGSDLSGVSSVRTSSSDRHVPDADFIGSELSDDSVPSQGPEVDYVGSSLSDESSLASGDPNSSRSSSQSANAWQHSRDRRDRRIRGSRRKNLGSKYEDTRSTSSIKEGEAGWTAKNWKTASKRTPVGNRPPNVSSFEPRDTTPRFSRHGRSLDVSQKGLRPSRAPLHARPDGAITERSISRIRARLTRIVSKLQGSKHLTLLTGSKLSVRLSLASQMLECIGNEVGYLDSNLRAAIRSAVVESAGFATIVQEVLEVLYDEMVFGAILKHLHDSYEQEVEAISHQAPNSAHTSVALLEDQHKQDLQQLFEERLLRLQGSRGTYSEKETSDLDWSSHTHSDNLESEPERVVRRPSMLKELGGQGTFYSRSQEYYFKGKQNEEEEELKIESIVEKPRPLILDRQGSGFYSRSSKYYYEGEENDYQEGEADQIRPVTL